MFFERKIDIDSRGKHLQITEIGYNVDDIITVMMGTALDPAAQSEPEYGASPGAAIGGHPPGAAQPNAPRVIRPRRSRPIPRESGCRVCRRGLARAGGARQIGWYRELSSSHVG